MTARRAPSEPVPWRDTEAAASYVGLGIVAFRRAVAQGEIAVIDDGGEQRHLVSDLDAYLAYKRRPAAWEMPMTRQERRVVSMSSGIGPVTGRPMDMRNEGSR